MTAQKKTRQRRSLIIHDEYHTNAERQETQFTHSIHFFDSQPLIHTILYHLLSLYWTFTLFQFKKFLLHIFIYIYIKCSDDNFYTAKIKTIAGRNKK